MSGPSASAGPVLPNYEAMLTPALSGELKRFGLKAIPRKKAVQILNHIYEQTHPVVVDVSDDEGEASPMASQESTASSQEGPDMPEESILALEDDDAPVTASQMPSEEDLTTKVHEYLRSDKDLRRMVLMYEPLWLEDFFAEFKSKTGVKCKINQVMDILDNECVTFRTRASGQSRRRKSPKKKKSSKKSN